MLKAAQVTGWAAAELASVGNSRDRLVALCESIARLRRAPLGRVSESEVLSPKRRDTAPPRSLSAIHGVGEFPGHVDGAHEPTPPRFLLLYCVADEQHRPTRLYDWHEIEVLLDCRSLLTREVFVFRNGRHSFADSILTESRTFVRFDRGCMLPATLGAERLLVDIEDVIRQVVPVELSWRPGLAIVVNNWCMLHGRGSAQLDGSRILLRAQFDCAEDIKAI